MTFSAAPAVEHFDQGVKLFAGVVVSPKPEVKVGSSISVLRTTSEGTIRKSLSNFGFHCIRPLWL